MKRIFFMLAGMAAFILIQTAALAQSRSFRLGQWEEIYNSILKELNRSYVDSLPLDRIMRAGIDQMLGELDPYTIYVPEEENSFAPSLCNRIDRNTAGIVIAAKNALTLRVMNEKIKKRTIAKYYLLAVHGNMEKKFGELTGYILKDAANNKVTVYEREPRGAHGAKKVVTRYRVVGKHAYGDILEAELVTGRTHQIRAHFASVGHPIVGDGKYAVNREDRKLGFESQELYSYKLTFLSDEPSHLDYLEGKTFTRDISDFPFADGIGKGKV